MRLFWSSPGTEMTSSPSSSATALVLLNVDFQTASLTCARMLGMQFDQRFSAAGSAVT